MQKTTDQGEEAKDLADIVFFHYSNYYLQTSFMDNSIYRKQGWSTTQCCRNKLAHIFLQRHILLVKGIAYSLRDW